jgi:hypothetical protein
MMNQRSAVCVSGGSYILAIWGNGTANKSIKQNKMMIGLAAKSLCFNAAAVPVKSAGASHITGGSAQDAGSSDRFGGLRTE